MPQNITERCVFFDRDGVVNRSPGKGYVLEWDQFTFTAGIAEVIKLVKQQGWLAILITSQRGVGKGLMSASDLQRIHFQMQKKLTQSQADFDAIYAYTETPNCPHVAKPDPEMLLTAAGSFNIDLAQSWMIGDSDRDIIMGHNAGLKGCIRFLSDKSPAVTAEYTVSDTTALKVLLADLL